MPVRRLWALVCAACFPAVAIAAFDETDVIQLEASASILHDDNLYRLPDLDQTLMTLLFPAIPPERRSDTVKTLGVGLKLNKPISRQKVLLDLSVNESRYDKNPGLDNTGYSGRAALLWQLGNHWNGEVIYRRQRYLAGFVDFRFFAKDLITSENTIVTGGYQFHPRWRIAAEVNTFSLDHSASERSTSNFKSDGEAVSVTYRTPSNNSIGLELRRREGEYPNRPVNGVSIFDNDFTQNEANALLAWRPTSAVKLDATLGWTERQYDKLSVRDFSGVTGKATAIWDATSKVRFTVTGNRGIRAYEDSQTSYVLVNSVSLSPAWAFLPKVTLQGDYIYETRDYRGDPLSDVRNLASREDTLKTARLALVYSAFSYVDLSITYEHGKRQSNQFINDFDYHSWFGTLRVRF